MSDLINQSAAGDLIDPRTVERDYLIPTTTQATWRCNRRYGWADLTVKVGRRVMYRRSAVEQWLRDREGVAA